MFPHPAADRLLQAAWDPTFSEASFGFRPGRSAHQAVARAQELIASGHGIVVDLDLEKFFDRVNHDILMGLVAKRVTDKRILKLIRSFLTAGVLIDRRRAGRTDGGGDAAARADYSPYAKGNLRRLAIDDLWSARSAHCRQLIRLERESSVG